MPESWLTSKVDPLVDRLYGREPEPQPDPNLEPLKLRLALGLQPAPSPEPEKPDFFNTPPEWFKRMQANYERNLQTPPQSLMAILKELFSR